MAGFLNTRKRALVPRKWDAVVICLLNKAPLPLFAISKVSSFFLFLFLFFFFFFFFNYWLLSFYLQLSVLLIWTANNNFVRIWAGVYAVFKKKLNCGCTNRVRVAEKQVTCTPKGKNSRGYVSCAAIKFSAFNRSRRPSERCSFLNIYLFCGLRYTYSVLFSLHVYIPSPPASLW